jgi:2-(1,2-epoxy-1,2-dihydrophenyl)acetyl-CoA isomerase
VERVTYERLIYERVGDVAVIRLNDPDTLNAMTDFMGSELLNALHRAETEARAVMLSSVGRAFCSGANLADATFDLDDPKRDVGVGVHSVFNPLLLDMRSSRLPIVTAVKGAAAGVGCGLACSGDMIVAGESAFFFPAFRHVGLSPDGGISYLLTKAIGRVRATELMLLGTKLPAAQALEWGLINRVVPDEAVEEEALKLATALAAGPQSLASIKDAAWAACDLPLAEQLQHERKLQRAAGMTADFVEGVAAYRDRRPAHFTGS